MNILLLGAGGFLGKELITNTHFEQNKVLKVVRKLSFPNDSQTISTEDPNFINIIRNFNPEVVINAMASWGGSVEEVNLAKSNLIVPLEIFSNINYSEIVWIQCNSYFNYHFENYQEDRDSYSRYKRHFTEIIQEQSKGFPTKIIDIRIPHLIGANQSKERVIPKMIQSLINHTQLDLGSGNQVIPLMHISDMANTLQMLVKESENSVFDTGKYFVRPVEQLSLREIGFHLEKLTMLRSLFNYGAFEDRPNENYEPVHFTGTELIPTDKNFTNLDSILLDSINGLYK